MQMIIRSSGSLTQNYFQITVVGTPIIKFPHSHRKSEEILFSHSWTARFFSKFHQPNDVMLCTDTFLKE